MPLIVDDYGGTPLHYAALAAGAPASGGAPLAWGDANVALLLGAQDLKAPHRLPPIGTISCPDDTSSSSSRLRRT